MGEVVGQPVHLPGAEQRLARRQHLGIIERELARRLFEHDLAHIRGIDRGPAESAQEDLGATVLGLADDLAACAEALVAEPRGRDADAVDIACG